jgi:hypothetical protein
MPPFYCPYCWKLIPDDASGCAFCLSSLTDWHEPKLIANLLEALRGTDKTRARFGAQMLARHQISQSTAPVFEFGETIGAPGLAESVKNYLGALREGEPTS